MSEESNTPAIARNEATQSDAWFIEAIRRGDPKAWELFIARYEGRLIAYVEQRLSGGSAAEDIVQETFIGFLNSLPNYDGSRALENYLFTICAHKMTDHLRRTSRRLTRSLDDSTGPGSLGDRLSGRWRAASSIARSHEQRLREEKALIEVLREQIEKWKGQGDWIKLACLELVIVAGRSNREAAQLLNLSEQKVANYKSDFIARTTQQIQRLQSKPVIAECLAKKS